jgi:hypothetical protein
METAILPVRYEIEHTAGTGTDSSALKQICASVISEGGYEQYVQESVIRRTTQIASVSTTFLPIASMRLKSTRAGAVVLLNRVLVLPTTNAYYEVALIKNPTTLTGASWNTSTFENVEFDVSATAVAYASETNLIQLDYVTSSSQGRSVLNAATGYNFGYQLGTSLAGVSDIFTLAARVRTLSPPSGDLFGSITFFDLTV